MLIPAASKDRRRLIALDTAHSFQLKKSPMHPLGGLVAVGDPLHHQVDPDASLERCKSTEGNPANHLRDTQQKQNATTRKHRKYTKCNNANHLKYKYLVHFEGYGHSARLAQVLSTNSVVFKQYAESQEFYYDLLEPWKHYVPFHMYSSAR